MFGSVKRFGFNEWINVFEQKYPKPTNYGLALKLYSAKGRDKNRIGGFPAHYALALKATTSPEKERPILFNNSLIKMLVFSCLGRALDGKGQNPVRSSSSVRGGNWNLTGKMKLPLDFSYNLGII